MLDSSLPPGFRVPDPELLASLQADEMPLEIETEATPADDEDIETDQDASDDEASSAS